FYHMRQTHEYPLPGDEDITLQSQCRRNVRVIGSQAIGGQPVCSRCRRHSIAAAPTTVMGHRPSGCPKYQEVVNFGFGSNSADRVAAEMTGLHPEADVLARALARSH